MSGARCKGLSSELENLWDPLFGAARNTLQFFHNAVSWARFSYDVEPEVLGLSDQEAGVEKDGSFMNL